MTVLLDSSAWLEYFFGSEIGEKVKPIIEGDSGIIVSKLNIFEIYHKILKERDKEEAEKFTSFVVLKSTIDDLDVDTLKLAAEEKKKFGLGMADAIVLATSIKYNVKIYTKDRDFEIAKSIVEVIFL